MNGPPPTPQERAAGAMTLRWWQRFHVRMTAGQGAIVFVVLSVMGFVFYEFGFNTELAGLQGRLKATVTTLAMHIDGESIAALDPSGEPNAPEVRELHARFKALVEADPDINTIYLLRRTDDPDQLRFVVDFASRGKTGRPGQRYDMSELPAMRAGLERVTVESRLWRDDFGLSLSGYAPIKRAGGETVALVGVDVEADRVEKMRDRVLLTTLAFYGVAGFLLVALALLIGRRIRGPLSDINAAAGRIAEGDFSGRIAIERKDEFGLVGRHFDTISESLQERDFIRDTFGRYVSPDVARRILSDRSASALGGEKRDATILFSDIQGYSTMNERVPPEEMIGVLNSYLGAMNEVIDAHDGCVIEFIGDAILCVFNTPNDVERHAEAAVRCAVAMRERLDALNAEWAPTRVGEIWRTSGVDRLRTRVGVHTGTVVAGNIGSRTRMKYGVLGDVVNVAARLEQMNKHLGTSILITQATFDRLAPELQAVATPCGPQAVRGREAPIEVYAV